MDNNIKISIITVSYNAAATIEKTIKSVLDQSYNNIEYIIIDGNSTDGTINIIKKYEKDIDYWVSEPDKGIYDAMNKGVRFATGSYIFFLGADDYLAGEMSIARVIDFMRRCPDQAFYYGNVYLYDSRLGLVKKSGKVLSIDEIKSGEMCAHQSLFTRGDIMKTYFDTKWRIAADFEFFLRHVLEGDSFFYMDSVVSFYNIDGVSADKAVYQEYADIINKYSGEKFLYRIRRIRQYDEKMSIRGLLKLIVRSVIGARNYMKCRGWKNYDGDFRA